MAHVQKRGAFPLASPLPGAGRSGTIPDLRSAERRRAVGLRHGGLEGAWGVGRSGARSLHVRHVGGRVGGHRRRPAAIDSGSRPPSRAGSPGPLLRRDALGQDHEPDGQAVHRRDAGHRRSRSIDRPQGRPGPRKGDAIRRGCRAHRSLPLRRRAAPGGGPTRDALPHGRPSEPTGHGRGARVGGARLHRRLHRVALGRARGAASRADQPRPQDHHRRRAAERAERTPRVGTAQDHGRTAGCVDPGALAKLLADQLDRNTVVRSGLVFPTPFGEPMRRSNFARRIWTPATAALGLDGLRFHDLRHTAVALAISQGAHPKALQERMGHSSVTVTLDRYGHLYDGLDGQIADGLDDLLRTSRGSARTPRS